MTFPEEAIIFPESVPGPNEIGLVVHWVGPVTRDSKLWNKLAELISEGNYKVVHAAPVGRNMAAQEPWRDAVRRYRREARNDESAEIQSGILTGALKLLIKSPEILRDLNDKKVEGLRSNPRQTLMVQLILGPGRLGARTPYHVGDLIYFLPEIRKQLSRVNHYQIDLYGFSRTGAMVSVLDLNYTNLTGWRFRRLRKKIEKCIDAEFDVMIKGADMR